MKVNWFRGLRVYTVETVCDLTQLLPVKCANAVARHFGVREDDPLLLRRVWVDSGSQPIAVMANGVVIKDW